MSRILLAGGPIGWRARDYLSLDLGRFGSACQWVGVYLTSEEVITHGKAIEEGAFERGQDSCIRFVEQAVQVQGRVDPRQGLGAFTVPRRVNRLFLAHGGASFCPCTCRCGGVGEGGAGRLETCATGLTPFGPLAPPSRAPARRRA